MRIIAFGGLAQAGKTAAAQHLAKVAFDSGYIPKIEHFAAPLKQAADILGASKKEQPELYRLVCQYLGSSFRDPEFEPGVTGPHYWVNMLHGRLRQAEKEEQKRLDSPTPIGFYETLVIIDDVRYQNEVDLIRRWNGTLAFVDAWARLRLTEEWDNLPKWRRDPSERLAWDYGMGIEPDELFDYALSNNGPIEMLHDAVESLFPLMSGEIPDVQ